MQNRIDRLEGLVLSLMTNGSQSAGPAAAMAALSGNSSSISSAQPATDLDVDEDAHGGPEESDTEQVTKSFGIMKVDNNNKSYYVSEAHWAAVLSDVSIVLPRSMTVPALTHPDFADRRSTQLLQHAQKTIRRASGKAQDHDATNRRVRLGSSFWHEQGRQPRRNHVIISFQIHNRHFDRSIFQLL